MNQEYTARSYSEHRADVYEEHAREIHQAENEARPGRPRIQLDEIRYLKKLLSSTSDPEIIGRLM